MILKILVLGACGTMGSSVVRDLVKGEDVGQVVAADRSLDLNRLHESVRNSPKLLTATIDVEDFDGLVKLMRAAIEARTNYIDIMDDYDTTIEAFDLDEEAKAAGVSICIGFGSSPGFNNIIVKYAADKLDQVEEADILWLYTLNDTGGAGVVAHMFHALEGDVPQYLNGELTFVPAGTGIEEVEFVEPFGRCPVYYVGHPEPVTIPRYIKGMKTCVNKAGILPLWGNQLFKDLLEYGFVSEEPIKVGGHSITPEQFISEFIQSAPSFKKHVEEWTTEAGKIIVKGYKDGTPVTYTYSSSGQMAPGTGIPASICAQMLVLGEITEKGVVAPEGFAKRGFRMTEMKSVTGEVEL
jgi:lysine 6-dehydrogenase